MVSAMITFTYCFLFTGSLRASILKQDSLSEMISLNYEGHILIKAEVEGIAGNFILDSGADNLYLDSLFYSSQNWSLTNVVKALLPGAGVKPKEIDYILDTLDLAFGDSYYKTNGVPVLDLKSIVGDRADGIVGFGFFKDRILKINYKDQWWEIYRELAQVDLTGFTEIPVEISENRILIPVEIDLTGDLTIDGKCLLDLGTSRSIILTSVTAKRHNLNQEIEHKVRYESSQSGVGGKSSGYDFRSQSIRIGPYQLNGAVLDYALDQSGALSSDRYLGLLGNEVLDRFVVLIDYRGSNIYLKPRSELSESFYASATGFSISDRSKTHGLWKVTGLHEGRQAMEAGLRIGDAITHVDGQKVASIDFRERLRLYRSREFIDLTVQRASESIRIRIRLKEIL